MIIITILILIGLFLLFLIAYRNDIKIVNNELKKLKVGSIWIGHEYKLENPNEKTPYVVITDYNKTDNGKLWVKYKRYDSDGILMSTYTDTFRNFLWYYKFDKDKK